MFFKCIILQEVLRVNEHKKNKNQLHNMHNIWIMGILGALERLCKIWSGIKLGR